MPQYSSNTNQLLFPLRHKIYMPVIRELMECARGFERCSNMHIRELALTPAQFDIVATLGNTEGMTCKELGEKTLITKGTMTGVLDRLEGKGLLVRVPSPEDGRSWITKLTRKGQALFEEVFPAHIKHMDPLFDDMSDDDLKKLRAQLRRLRDAFDAAGDAFHTTEKESRGTA